jgi:pilus assembly protein CpaF
MGRQMYGSGSAAPKQAPAQTGPSLKTQTSAVSEALNESSRSRKSVKSTNPTVDDLGDGGISNKDFSNIVNKSSDDKIVETVVKREQARADKLAAKKNGKQSDDEITIGKLDDAAFGDMLPYIQDDSVTDINWNGRQLWIDDLKHGRYCSKTVLTDQFVRQFATRVSNVVSENFNKYNPKLEAETEELRISILHSSVAHTGISISIRKTPAVKRISFAKQIKNGDYCSEEMANFMSNAVKAGFTTIVCGLPGDGKTELVKYLTSYIPPKDRVITIEDNLEIHYHSINPDKDCVELKVDESFTYVDAIKASLRQLPRWIMVAEARSVEIKYLIEAVSTGAHCMTTIHTDDVRKLPSRIKNMMGSANEEGAEADIYTFINMGILIRKKYDEKGNIYRYLSQIGVFDEEKHEVVLIYDEGKRTGNDMPPAIKRKFMLAGIADPFVYTKLPW